MGILVILRELDGVCLQNNLTFVVAAMQMSV